jgi:hypothetical protein
VITKSERDKEEGSRYSKKEDRKQGRNAKKERTK